METKIMVYHIKILLLINYHIVYLYKKIGNDNKYKN